MTLDHNGTQRLSLQAVFGRSRTTCARRWGAVTDPPTPGAARQTTGPASDTLFFRTACANSWAIGASKPSAAEGSSADFSDAMLPCAETGHLGLSDHRPALTDWFDQ